MKKVIYLLMIVVLPALLSANVMDVDPPKKKKKRKKSKTEAVRADRQIALTAVSGWNSLVGAGVTGTYYVMPKLGIDVGAGIGLKGPKVGVRGRYLFSEKNFSPYVGLGFDQTFLKASDIFLVNETTGGTIIYDVNRTTFTQLTVGFEFMSNGGFVIGLNAGYALALNDAYTITSGELDNISKTALNIALGSGLALEFNIGYAF